MRPLLQFVYALLVVCLLVGGCSLSGADEQTPYQMFVDLSRFSRDSTLLVGEWHWTRTVCCYGDLGVSTPGSTGESETLIVTEDDTVEVYRNDSLEKRRSLDEYLDRARWGVTEDSLVVSWAYIDGPQRVYVRAE